MKLSDRKPLEPLRARRLKARIRKVLDLLLAAEQSGDKRSKAIFHDLYDELNRLLAHYYKTKTRVPEP